jgi:capsule polysaccharide export protein KpsE/RkpR
VAKAAGSAVKSKGAKLAHEATSDTLKLAEAALREAEKRLEAARKQLDEVE